MFSLLKEYTKEYTKGKSSEKENDKDKGCDAVIDKQIVETINMLEKEEVDDNESDRIMNEDSTRWGKYIDKLMEMPRSRPIGYYLKHEINKKTIEDLVDNHNHNDSLLATRLGIVEDVLVDVAGFVYPMDFIILDIKEDDYMPLILGTPFLTTAMAKIKCDKGSMTLRARKFKVGKNLSFSIARFRGGTLFCVRSAEAFCCTYLDFQAQSEVRIEEGKDQKGPTKWRHTNGRLALIAVISSFLSLVSSSPCGGKTEREECAKGRGKQRKMRKVIPPKVEMDHVRVVFELEVQAKLQLIF
ncbi:retrovirus-related pol polyprotein from transposon TNT 1-94 [Tanacetum coccineum]